MESGRNHQVQREACFCHVRHEEAVGRAGGVADKQVGSERVVIPMADGDGSSCCDAGAWDGGGVEYDRSEQDVLIDVFTSMLRAVTKDGGKKRAAGVKPPWWRDGAHEGAIFSHITKWKRGERMDPDSGAHPLVHAAWRCLAIAYQEVYGKVDPE